MEVFLFNKVISQGEIGVIEEREFLSFSISNQLASQYEDSWQINNEGKISQLKVKDFDKKFDDWYERNIALKSRLFAAYTAHFKEDFTMEDFKFFYKENEAERKCSYCGITQAEISKLRVHGLIRTKRNRGKQMEIDRVNSNMEYMKGNIVLACYYCNNAKTDEFSPEEFKAIGKEIKKIWDSRLSKIKTE